MCKSCTSATGRRSTDCSMKILAEPLQGLVRCWAIRFGGTKSLSFFSLPFTLIAVTRQKIQSYRHRYANDVRKAMAARSALLNTLRHRAKLRGQQQQQQTKFKLQEVGNKKMPRNGQECDCLFTAFSYRRMVVCRERD